MANQVKLVRKILAGFSLLFSLWLIGTGIGAFPHGGVAGGPIMWIGLFGGASVLAVVCILIILGRR